MAAGAPAEAVPAPAAAVAEGDGQGPFVDLSGVYELDLKASDPISPFLKEVGAPWIARKAADSMTSTITIGHTAEKFDIENKNFFSTNKNSMLIGKECDWVAGDGSKIPMTTTVLENGTVRIQGPYPKEPTKTFQNNHWKTDTGVILEICMLGPDGKDRVRVRRVFTAKASK